VLPIHWLRPRSALGSGLALTGLLICAGCSGDGNDPVEPPTSSTRAALPDAAAGSSRPDAGGSAAGPTPSPSSTVSARSAAAEKCVQQAFGELSAAQRAGQLVMTGTPAGNPAPARALVRRERLGGVFLSGRTSDSPATIRKAVAELPAQKTRTTTIKLLISVDQEGGKVQALQGGSWTTVPSARTQGTWSKRRLTDRTRAWVAQLRRAGVNMDLGPVADTVPAGTEQRNPPIGVFGRQYGNTAPRVSDRIRTVTETMRAGKVIPTVKHFPGLGRVRYNTDSSSRAVDRTTSVTSAYLKPFEAGIEAGAGAVMVSSARYPRIDDQQPAVFSAPVITELLRGRMKYQGVVMTDDVGRAVAVQGVPRGRRATRFIAAGGDLVLTVVPEAAPTMVDAIVAKARSNAGFRAKVNASTQRVLRLKQQSGLLTCS
jgi:beta-N-acetylhexosaminidase